LARPQRWLSAVLVVGIALAGLLAAGRWLQPRLDHETPVGSSTRPPPTSPVLTSQPVVTATGPPGSPGITKTAATAAQVDAIAVTPGSVWVAAGGLVLRVDPVTGRRVVVPDIETGQPPVVQVTVGAGAVWATTTAGRQLLRIDPRTARVTASLSVPAQGVAADAGGVWVVCCWAGAHRGQLTRVDPASGRVVKVIPLPGRPQAVGIGPSGVWVRGAEGSVWRVEPASNRVVATIRLPSSNGQSYRVDTGDPGGDIAVTNEGVWVSNPGSATVRRIDPRRNHVTDDLVEADGSDLTVAADGVVWATSDTRLLGRGLGSEVLGPRRNLHELDTDRITATAAARDGGLWLGTPEGLFHVDPSLLREG
jgi:ligand-binding sensor domain-containing protein